MFRESTARDSLLPPSLRGLRYGALFYLVYYVAFSVLFVRTQFDPDEYYQVLEPALRLAGMEGYETWEWRRGVRSWLAPLPYALLYRLGGGPASVRALNGLQCWLLTRLVSGLHSRVHAMGRDRTRLHVVMAASWFVLYGCCRSYANVTEAVLCAAVMGRVVKWEQPSEGDFFVVSKGGGA